MKTETDVQNSIRIQGDSVGIPLWRNNVGVLKDITGRPVRFGLANDSKQMNEKFKSLDLIGITPVVVDEAMLGKVIGIFTAIETKKPGWVFTGTAHEKAQMAFATYVQQHGGIAQFAQGMEDVQWMLRDQDDGT